MPKQGIEVLKNFIKICDDRPGIYKMVGQNDTILYIGKAKKLKSRLSDYLQFHALNKKTQIFISNIAKIEIVVTSNEMEAIFLESNLVRKIQPKYNILLKDDKSFPYILIDETSDYPRIVKYRGKKDCKGSYFGPFASAHKVDEVIGILQKAFLLRTCSDSFLRSRKRPCILYQIKKCSAPCVEKINKVDYKKLVQQVKKHLSGKDDSLQKDLNKLMSMASKELDYEKAALYRDRLNALGVIRSRQIVDLPGSKDFDVISIVSNGDIAALEVFFVREGINLGNKTYYWDDIKISSPEEILSSFLFNFYKNNSAPKNILINKNIPEESLLKKFLSEENGSIVSVSFPQRGIKKEMLEMAENNAENNLTRRYHSNKKHMLQFDALQKMFNIDKQINRIEIYDNSHFAGKAAVGVMVVCGRNGFNKNEYRKYNIKTLSQKPDDYEMFREVLSRRFKDKSNIPEFMIIDGGVGQVSTAKSICDSMGVETCIIGMSKGPNRNSGEEIICLVDGKNMVLDKHNKVKQYMQVLRDEAHRFAITFHRKKRDKESFKSIFDDLEGVGKVRQRNLMDYFGSVGGLKEASVKELMKVDQIDKKNAEKIYKYFHYYL
jgi:excinuclease ABC subunit C